MCSTRDDVVAGVRDHGQVSARRVERGDALDDVGEAAAVGLEPVDETVRLAGHVRRAAEQAGEAGLGERVGVERGDRREPGGDEDGGEPAGDLRGAPPHPAVDEQGEPARADQGAPGRPPGRPDRRRPERLRGRHLQADEAARVGEQLPGGVDVDLGDPGLDRDRPLVGVEPDPADRGQEEPHPGVQARDDADVDQQRADAACVDGASIEPRAAPATATSRTAAQCSAARASGRHRSAPRPARRGRPPRRAAAGRRASRVLVAAHRLQSRPKAPQRPAKGALRCRTSVGPGTPHGAMATHGGLDGTRGYRDPTPGETPEGVTSDGQRGHRETCSPIPGVCDRAARWFLATPRDRG